MFIKTACCFPERVTKSDYDSILKELQHSEKVSRGEERILNKLQSGRLTLSFSFSVGPREFDDPGGEEPGGAFVCTSRYYALYDMMSMMI